MNLRPLLYSAAVPVAARGRLRFGRAVLSTARQKDCSQAKALIGTTPRSYQNCRDFQNCGLWRSNPSEQFRYGVARSLSSSTIHFVSDSSLLEKTTTEESDDDDTEEQETEPRLWFQPEGSDTGIVVRNGLTRTKVPLIAKDKTLTWYMCGPTVYDDAHIGHASCYVRFDVIRRILTDHFNLDVVLVMGITDIDDKIIARSKILGQTPSQIAKHYETRFLADLARLDVFPPTFLSRVSDFIPCIIEFVERIVDRGHAYHSNGSVYFDVASFDGKDYPRLMNPIPAAAGVVAEGGAAPNESEAASSSSSLSSSWQSSKNVKASEKKDPRDFALWKAAKEGEPGWSSPWGQGRPGWHIECSAMGSRVFGSQIDLHSGGIDLLFPHHENEITQCHAYHDYPDDNEDCQQRQWVNYWLHAGHLTLEDDDVKMSKSLNNTVSIEELLQNYSSNQFRMFCLMSRYRSTMRFSASRMERAVEFCHSVSSFLHIAQTYIHGKHNCDDGGIDVERLTRILAETKAGIDAAFADDFDTPTAMRHLANLVHEGYAQLARPKTLNDSESDSDGNALSTDNPAARRIFIAYVSYITRIFRVLGLSESDPSSSSSDIRFRSVMDSLVEFRSLVREFALSAPTSSEVESSSSEMSQLSDAELKKRRKTQMRKERRPLLSACDILRENLAAQGLQIVDQTKNRPDLKSTWKATELKGKS